MEKYGTVEVDFRLVGGANPLIFVPTFVNGNGPYQFILDTGAGISLLSPELAHNLGIHAVENREAVGAGGKVNLALGSVESLAIGQARLENVQIAITDEIQRIGAVMGEQIDGDIGYSYLKSFKLTLDYSKNTLRLTHQDQKDVGENPNSSYVRFMLADPAKPLILVPVYLNGKGPYRFALDTGASMTVISDRLAQNLGLTHTGACDSTGAGGAVKAVVADVDSIAMGTAQLKNLAVAVTNALSQISQTVKAELDGIIGYNFLKAFTVTIDYPNSILYLEQIYTKRFINK